MTNDGDRLHGISNVRKALAHYKYSENTHHLSYIDIEIYFITFLCLFMSLSILSIYIVFIL